MADIENKFCCERALEILLKNVKDIEHLNLIENSIDDYEKTFGYDLNKYRKMVNEFKRGYWTNG